MSRRLRPPLPIIASGIAALVLLVLAVALPGDGVSPFLVRLLELALASGAAYLLDDDAAHMTVVTPRSVWHRRAPALVSGTAVLAATWLVVLLVLRRHEFPLSALALTGELLVLGALAVALAAVLVWRGDPVPGSRVAPVLGLGGFTVLLAEPTLRISVFPPSDGGAARWVSWFVVGVAAVMITLVASRDPASRWRR